MFFFDVLLRWKSKLVKIMKLEEVVFMDEKVFCDVGRLKINEGSRSLGGI